MKEKLKKWWLNLKKRVDEKDPKLIRNVEILIDIQFTILFLCVILVLASIYIEETGVDIMNWQDIMIAIGINVITTVGITVCVYYKFLGNIPDENRKKIDELLNDRLNYETTNHNAVLGALNPNNKIVRDDLAKQHDEIKGELKERHNEIKQQLADGNAEIRSNMQFLRENVVREEEKLANMNEKQIDLQKTAEALKSIVNSNYNLLAEKDTMLNEQKTFELKIIELETTNKKLQKQNQELQEQVTSLTKTIEELSEPVAPAVTKRQTAHKQECDER